MKYISSAVIMFLLFCTGASGESGASIITGGFGIALSF